MSEYIKAEAIRWINVEDLLNSGRLMGCNVCGHLSTWEGIIYMLSNKIINSYSSIVLSLRAMCICMHEWWHHKNWKKQRKHFSGHWLQGEYPRGLSFCLQCRLRHLLLTAITKEGEPARAPSFWQIGCWTNKQLWPPACENAEPFSTLYQ